MLLEMIQSYFGVGKINKSRADAIRYRVGSTKELIVIINHFDKFPLITQKRADFELFKQVVEIINRQEHLTLDGFKKIVSLKASMNNGLSERQKAAFPNTKPVPRLIVGVDQEIKDPAPHTSCGVTDHHLAGADPHWLAGFVSGEGCFFINIAKSSSLGKAEGSRVQL